ncbi:MAG: hypothetical protein K0V04_40005 [Deltaproteobacteria bacterium]|nr:hypothetical protein [Deltaproteobacteria bacterium]
MRWRRHWLSVREDRGVSCFETSKGWRCSGLTHTPAPFDLSDACIGIVGMNWGALPQDRDASAESFQLACGQ